MQAMGSSEIVLVAAFFIGLMMAISPCPLATNIAAIAYISKRLDKKKTIWIGLVYTFGRMFAYTSLALLIVWFGINTQAISLALQKDGERLLGPLLIIIGVVMLELVKLPVFGGSARLEKLKEKLSRMGFLGSFLLGAIFALAFCPFSAVLFFGMLIPLAIMAGDPLFVPAVFAFATGLPVVLFSAALVHGISKLGETVKKVQAFERWMRLAASVVFVLVGVYYTLWITLGWI